MADGVIGQMLETVSLQGPHGQKPIPEWAIDATKEKRRNMITSIYLDHDDLENVNIKLQEKYAAIQKAEQLSISYCTEDAELVKD